MPRYRITGGSTGEIGLDYRTTRAEPGDVVDDLPRDSIKWLREQGLIEQVRAGEPTEAGSDDDGDEIAEGETP